MPPVDRFVPRFAAEPPQELLPYGRWADKLREEFLAACLQIEDEVGEPGNIVWFPDRTWGGRTYVPATCRTSSNLELYGVVSFAPAVEDGQEPEHFVSSADWTEETVEANPEWKIDVCEEVVGGWRGENGAPQSGDSQSGHFVERPLPVNSVNRGELLFLVIERLPDKIRSVESGGAIAASRTYL